MSEETLKLMSDASFQEALFIQPQSNYHQKALTDAYLVECDSCKEVFSLAEMLTHSKMHGRPKCPNCGGKLA